VFSAHAVSHPGNVRKINEDSWRMDLDLGVFVVADGMGGHNAGEVASDMAVETILNFMRRTYEGDDVTWPFGVDPNLSFEGNRIMTAIRLGNRRVFKAAESRDEFTGMGTTVVVALVDDSRVVFAGVGDSRIYLLRDGELTQLTKDDSWIATLRAGDPSADLATKHPMRHVLTNVVGAREQVDLDVFERDLKDGDILLLCSDGLHGEIDDQGLASLMRNGTTPEAIADAMVKQTLTGRAPDNVTAMIVKYTA
jgi:serine/threonine protein phosphatase PrpC